MQDGKYVILHIDDDPDCLEIVRAILETEDYIVHQAPSAEDGLKLYDDVAPDAIISDLMMEEVDAGTSAVKEFRIKNADIPIFMLTGVGDELTQSADTSELGITGVFQKPINPATLISVLESKLKR